MGSQQTKDEKAIIEPWGAQLPGNAGKRTCLITGGNSGLGFESARSLLVKGYKVIIACRNAEKATAAVSKLKSLSVCLIPIKFARFLSCNLLGLV